MAKNKLLSKALSWFKKSEGNAAVETVNESEGAESTASVSAPAPVPMTMAPQPAQAPQYVPVPAPEPMSKAAPAPTPKVTPAPPKPVVTAQPAPSAPNVKVHAPVAAPAAPIQTIIEEGPEIKITTKGSKVYAICPHCEATWNLKERLLVYSTKRVAAALTCPSCDKAISLPVSLNLKKLSSM